MASLVLSSGDDTKNTGALRDGFSDFVHNPAGIFPTENLIDLNKDCNKCKVCIHFKQNCTENIPMYFVLQKQDD